MPEYLYSINDKKTKMQFLGLYKTSFKKLLLSKKWREKISFLKSIGRLNNIYDHSIMFSEIFLMCIQLCFDTVNKVRIKAAKILSKLIFQFFNTEDEQYKIKSIVIIRIFATCIHYHYRQLFVYISIDLIGVDGRERLVSEDEAKSKCEENKLIWGGECSVKTFTLDQLKELIKGYVLKIYEKVGAKIVKQQMSKKLATKKKKKKPCFI